MTKTQYLFAAWYAVNLSLNTATLKILNSRLYKIALKKKWKCPICGERLFNREDIHQHHIKQIKDSGYDFEDNLILILIVYANASKPIRNIDAIATCPRLPQRTQRVKKEFGAASYRNGIIYKNCHYNLHSQREPEQLD